MVVLALIHRLNCKLLLIHKNKSGAQHHLRNLMPHFSSNNHWKTCITRRVNESLSHIFHSRQTEPHNGGAKIRPAGKTRTERRHDPAEPHKNHNPPAGPGDGPADKHEARAAVGRREKRRHPEQGAGQGDQDRAADEVADEDPAGATGERRQGGAAVHPEAGRRQSAGAVGQSDHSGAAADHLRAAASD